MAQGRHQPRLVIQLAHHLKKAGSAARQNFILVNPMQQSIVVANSKSSPRRNGSSFVSSLQLMLALRFSTKNLAKRGLQLALTLRDSSNASFASRSLFAMVLPSRILTATVVSCHVPM